MKQRIGIGLAVVALVAVIAGVAMYLTAGRESTDDAQVDGRVTPVAARVGGTVREVRVVENATVKAGEVLVALDTRDFQVALDRAKAELADAEAAAQAAGAALSVTTTTSANGVTTARESLEQLKAGVEDAQKGVEAARARLGTAEARAREVAVNVRKTGQDVDRLKGLLAKDEVSQQQFDAAAAAADMAKATAESAAAQVKEAEAGIRSAESRLKAAQAAVQRGTADLGTAQTAPSQVAGAKARAASALARVEQARAQVAQAELHLQYATVMAPADGIVSRKSVEPGQVVQPGQPLLSVVSLSDVWVTANFKETQIADMRPGQKVRLKVDAFGGSPLNAHVESVAPATGARYSLLPPNNATGNYVKVVQRVPVRIAVDAGAADARVLRPGMSVEPTVYTR